MTTARDQATLGRAIQERFPRYYRYFATTVFNYRGQSIRNHNHLLGKVEGIDGIKTGYTRASGFNLVSSMRRGNRHLIGVVLGGRSGRFARRHHAQPAGREPRKGRDQGIPSPRSPSAILPTALRRGRSRTAPRPTATVAGQRRRRCRPKLPCPLARAKAVAAGGRCGGPAPAAGQDRRIKPSRNPRH